jgi:diguanylate cyclase (GGDEF)-like protein
VISACARVGRALRTALLVFIALAMSATASARQSPLSEAFAETWTTRDGLPHSTVNAVAQTADSYLWLATWEGIARYGGGEFRLFRSDDIPGLLDDSVRAIHLGPHGDLWAGSGRGGIVRLRAGRWTSLPPVFGMVTDLHEERSGRLWVATLRSGLVRIDGPRRHAYTTAEGLATDVVNAVAIDRAGRAWAGTAQGLARIEGDRARMLRSGLPAGPVLALHALPDGRLVVGTERGAYVGDGAAFVPLHPDLAGDAVIRIAHDPDGALWLGTLSAGLVRLHRGVLERMGVEDGLPNSRVLTLLRDREKSLWIGTNGGLVRLREAPIRTFTRRDGLRDDFVRAVVVQGRDVWLGTSRGLSHLDRETGEASTRGDGTLLGSASVLSLAADPRGGTWVGTFYDGALLWERGRIARRVDAASGLPSNEVRVVVPARDGRVWVGTKQGLAVAAPSGAVRVYDTDDGLPGDYVQALHEDAEGAIWVGTGTGLGLVRGDRVGAVDIATAAQAQYVFGFLERPKTPHVIAATDRGLLRIERRTGRVRVVGPAQGLPFRKVFAAVDDGMGGIWITGNQGIARLDATDLDAAFDGRLPRVHARLFGHSDGMATSQANGGSNPPATFDGRHLWVATALGVARVDPAASVRPPPALAPVVFERFDVDGRAVDTSRAVTLPPGSGRIEIGYASPSLLSARHVHYRYRLEGFGDEWVDVGPRRDLQFTNLDPGQYRLHVAAHLPGDARRVRAATLAFVVERTWWQRPGVWIALGLSLLAGLGLVYAWRVGRLRASERRLQRLVDQKTAALQVQTEIAERLARTDPLTKLANRRGLDEALQSIATELRDGDAVSLVLVDIDHFKQVNDRYTHIVGDLALRAVADALQAQSRQRDVAARWGGEEFALLLRDCGREQALAVAERIRAAVQALDCSGFAPGLHVRVSAGVATADDRTRAMSLMADADRALMRAKAEGRNRVCMAAGAAVPA